VSKIKIPTNNKTVYFVALHSGAFSQTGTWDLLSCMCSEPFYFYKPAFIVLSHRKFNISPSVDRNLKSASNQLESQAEGDPLLKTSGNKMVLYFVAILWTCLTLCYSGENVSPRTVTFKIGLG